MIEIILGGDFEEGARPVKTASGNASTGLSKKVKIPRDYTPRNETVGQRPAECNGEGGGKKGKK